jgi:hypothetical protein
MNISLEQINNIKLLVADIQYLPYHRCPKCGALPRTIETGAWIRPYQDWFHTALSGWLDHLGYVYFQCDCRHHPQFQGALRIAHLGDAIVPVEFDDGTLAHQVGLETAIFNAEHVRQAVNFLKQNANPTFTGGTDWLLQKLYSLSAGVISPEKTWCEILRWAEQQLVFTETSETG